MDRKLQRHRADSLRQHGFLVVVIIIIARIPFQWCSCSCSWRRCETYAGWFPSVSLPSSNSLVKWSVSSVCLSVC